MQTTSNKPKSENWGGKRNNAGRKCKYGERTKVLTFRVPVSKAEEIKKAVKFMLDQPQQIDY
jgi:hypothetical protein